MRTDAAELVHAGEGAQDGPVADVDVPRDLVIDSLARRGVGTSVHFIPVHQLSAYQRILGPEECRSVPVTDQVADELISLPMYPGLADTEIEHVVQALLATTGCAVAV